MPGGVLCVPSDDPRVVAGRAAQAASLLGRTTTARFIGPEVQLRIERADPATLITVMLSRLKMNVTRSKAAHMSLFAGMFRSLVREDTA
jgi:hypothetical protein